MNQALPPIPSEIIYSIEGGVISVDVDGAEVELRLNNGITISVGEMYEIDGSCMEGGFAMNCSNKAMASEFVTYKQLQALFEACREHLENLSEMPSFS